MTEEQTDTILKANMAQRAMSMTRLLDYGYADAASLFVRASARNENLGRRAGQQMTGESR